MIVLKKIGVALLFTVISFVVVAAVLIVFSFLGFAMNYIDINYGDAGSAVGVFFIIFVVILVILLRDKTISKMWR